VSEELIGRTASGRPIIRCGVEGSTNESSLGSDRSARRRSWWVIGAPAGFGFVVGAVIAAVWLTHGIDTAGTPPSLVHEHPRSSTIVVAPDTPVIRARLAPVRGKVTFRWHYDNHLPGDTFRWAKSAAARAHTVTKPTLLIHTAHPADTCIGVSVVRRTGVTSRWSLPACG
jgi:hypothetical protein